MEDSEDLEQDKAEVAGEEQDEWADFDVGAAQKRAYASRPDL